jgi:hypothetical protein
MNHYAWIFALPPGTLVAIADGEMETIGVAGGPLGFEPMRIESRGEARNWAIENDVSCQDSPGGGGYALIAATPDQAMMIRLRWH